MPNLLYVMAGGAIGAGLRFEVGRLALRQLGPGFPWGTLIVNLAGGLAMGLVAGLGARAAGVSEGARLFLAVGVLGGFTTFSAFSLELLTMIERGELVVALLYAAGSVVAGLALAAAGFTIGRAAA